MSLVGTRDASWYRRPETRGPKRFHTTSGPRHDPTAACNTQVPLDPESVRRAEDVRRGMDP